MKNTIVTILLMLAALFLIAGEIQKHPEPALDYSSARALHKLQALNTRLNKLDQDIIYFARQLTQYEINRRAREINTAPVPAFLLRPRITQINTDFSSSFITHHSSLPSLSHGGF